MSQTSVVAFGANPAVIAAQVVVATRFGVGLAALGLPGGSLWPLIIHHAPGVISVQLEDVSGAWRRILMVGGDVIPLIFGLLILRRSSKNSSTHSDHS